MHVSDEHNSEGTNFLYPQSFAWDPSFRLPPQLRAEVSIFCRGYSLSNLTPSCDIKVTFHQTVTANASISGYLTFARCFEVVWMYAKSDFLGIVGEQRLASHSLAGAREVCAFPQQRNTYFKRFIPTLSFTKYMLRVVLIIRSIRFPFHLA